MGSQARAEAPRGAARGSGETQVLPSEAEGKMRPPDKESGEAGLGLLLAERTRPKQKARLEARRAEFSSLSLKTSGSQT